MRAALEFAARGRDAGEVPVGAVVVLDGAIIGDGFNQMVHARIGRLVYGAPEPKAGAIESAMRAHEHPSLNHRIEVTGHVLEAECRAAMQAFFADRRRAP